MPYLALLACATMLALPAEAQSRGLVAGQRLLGAWAGFSWTDALGPGYSTIPSKPYAVVTLRAEYVLEARDPFAFSFFMELLPLIAVRGVPQYHVQEQWQPPAGPMVPVKVWGKEAVVYGAGVTPIGVQGYARLIGAWSLFASGSGGISWFTRDMPVPDARQLNFILDAGMGVRRELSPRDALLVGLKMQHISNANRGAQNPGLEGNVLWAGWMWAR